MASTLFGMISDNNSRLYTLPALHSFLQHTRLTDQDRLILIDNDNSMAKWQVPCESFVPIKPRSFAANINVLIDMANDNQKDLCFLSNDIYFTPNWWELLASNEQEAILLPTCNQTNHYAFDNLKITSCMQLSQVADNLSRIDAVAKYSNAITANTFFTTRLMKFYCFKLPRAVYLKLGYMDDTVGSLADIDYRLRAINMGIPTAYVGGTYLLHYNIVSKLDTNTVCQSAFINKWNRHLTDICLSTDGSDINSILTKLNLIDTANGNWHVLLKMVINASQ